jgi:uncharacterized protein DUF4288
MLVAKKKSETPPYRNRSPYGWWIASYIVRFEYEDENKGDLNRRCLAWENTIIIKAKNREQAYRKATKIGQGSNDNEGYNAANGRKGKWKYEGLTSLIPIYEELEDGAEIIWKEHQNRSVKKIKSWVKSKELLEAFDDNSTAA